jgi:hypothetical protein
LKDGVEWKSFISANFSDYPKNTKDKTTFQFKKFTSSIDYPVYNETSSIQNIPLSKGLYNIIPRRFDGKDQDLICAASGIYYRNDDAIYQEYSLDPRKVNTLEVLKWNEDTKEIYGVIHANFVTSGVPPEKGETIALKNCYFKAIVK